MYTDTHFYKQSGNELRAQSCLAVACGREILAVAYEPDI